MDKADKNYQKLIQDAKSIITNNGLDGLSIRKLATQSKVSVGYLYNYFENKDALLNALSQDFYINHLHDRICKIDLDITFIDYLESLYLILKEQSYFLAIYPALSSDFKSHLSSGIEKVLLADSRIDKDLFINTKSDDLSQYIVDHMLYTLTQEKSQFAIFINLLTNTLYKEIK